MLFPSGFASLVVQVLTSGFDVWGLTIPVKPEFSILKELLSIELAVQLIEMVFYIWMVYHIHSLKNVTLYRYYDWAITTPVMLVTLMAVLAFDPAKPVDFMSFVKANTSPITDVLLLNFAMLVAGFCGELNPELQLPFSAIGFAPFVLYYYKIYNFYQANNGETNEALDPIFTKRFLFYFFLAIWTLYGVAAFFGYVSKNVAYNILDLFAKNLFGLILVYLVYQKRVKA
jgi:bacteriorhodopsin